MKTWSFFDPATGLFSGRGFSGTEMALSENTPDGLVPIEGTYDRRSQRIDVATGAVVAHEPTAPEIAADSHAALKRQRRQRIVALEQKQLRPLREIAIDPSNAEAKQRLQEIDDEIAAKRAELRQP